MFDNFKKVLKMQADNDAKVQRKLFDETYQSPNARPRVGQQQKGQRRNQHDDEAPEATPNPAPKKNPKKQGKGANTSTRKVVRFMI